jgi:DNA-binding transcriptional MerR regulator
MEEVLSMANELALDIDERTFKYYLSLEIISKPVKNPFPEGDKRVKFYPAQVMDDLKRIFQLKSRGFSLKQIKKLMLEDKSKELTTLVTVTQKDEKREMAHDFLRTITGPELGEAWKDFMSSAMSDVSDKNLHDAVKVYLGRLLGSWLESDEAGKYVEDFFINLDPDDREELIEPFRKKRDDELLKHKADRLDLLRYLQKLCGRVILGRYNRLEVLEWLDGISANLQKVKAEYEEKKSDDSIEREIQWFMLKGLNLYLEALSEIKENLSSKKREVLIASLGKARSAHNVIKTLEEITEKKKVLLSLMQ